jgi:hypothetical protein
MKTYKIKIDASTATRMTMIVIDRDTRQVLAEYSLTNGREYSEVRQMRRAIDAHLNKPGSTLNNFPW